MIGASELIITPDGRVYHIHLRPEELADTVITVGDPDRVPAVSKYFDAVEVKTQHREFVAHTGRIGGKRLTVLSSGIGPDNIDIVMNELDALVNIDFNTREILPGHRSLNIVRMGTSGSLQADIPVDSLVASTHGIGLDNVLHYYNWTAGAEETALQSAFAEHAGLDASPITPYAVQGSEVLLSRFGSAFHRGITVTCPGFYAPQGRVVRAPLRFPALVDRLSSFRHEQHRITNFEMETSAIFGLGRVLGHECLAINTIVANRVSKSFTADAPAAVDRMIRLGLEALTAS
jgi:uridine phosphorylase